MTSVGGMMRKKHRGHRFNWQIFLMAMAGVIFLAIFAYVPMSGIAMAFKNLDYSMNVMKDLSNKPWVGFDNFVKFIKDAQFKTVMSNTLTLGILELVITFPIPIFFALLLNELRSSNFRKVIQTTT
jgi:putative aldouronate transport system permease protein